MGVGARPPYFLTRLSKGAIAGLSDDGRLVIRAAVAVAGGLLFCSPVAAQNPPPALRAQHVEIIKGPALEISHDDVAIVRWILIIREAMTTITP
jgi:hypothetical protein